MNTEPMIQEELEDLRAKSDKLPTLTWEELWVYDVQNGMGLIHDDLTYEQMDGVRDFLLAAQNALPRLIAEVERLRHEAASYKQAYQEMRQVKVLEHKGRREEYETTIAVLQGENERLRSELKDARGNLCEDCGQDLDKEWHWGDCPHYEGGAS